MQTSGTARARFTATTFAAVVSHIANHTAAMWALVLGGGAWVEIRRPRPQARWILSLQLPPSERTSGPQRAVIVTLDEMLRFEIVSAEENEPVTLAGGFRKVEAALGFALDYVAAPVWHQGAQAEPDATAV